LEACELKIRAACDLGGLGAEEGPPVVLAYTPPSLLPQLLPWLAILALLALKSNRSPSAWLIWLPLAAVLGISAGVLAWLDLPQSGRGLLELIRNALVFGMAAVWLLAPHLRGRHRLLTLLNITLAQAGFSLGTYLVQGGLEESWGEGLPGLFALAMLSLTLAVAITLAGLVCRRHHHLPRFLLWLAVCLVGTCFLVNTPFFIIAAVVSGGSIPLAQYVAVTLLAAGIILGMMLPFLVLAAAAPLFRQRLQNLLHTDEPPLIPGNSPAPAPPPVGSEASP
jgi:hypothetical protein